MTLREACVGRQPIYDSRRKVVAYELLFRRPGGDKADFSDGDQATAEVIVNSILHVGLENVAASEPVFLNCTRHFLEQDPVLPPDRCVLEVLENIEVDARLIEAVRRLRGLGYKIALDDFVYREALDPLVLLADFIKVDVLAHNSEELAAQVRSLSRFPATLLAEKIDSEEDFQYCQKLGFRLFQGYFLRKPETLKARPAPSSKMKLISVLQQLANPDVSLSRVANAIGDDVTLSYRLLRLANSSLIGRRVEVHSIRDAVVTIGCDQLLRWATLLAMTGFDDCPPSYLDLALQRAATCERLAEAWRSRKSAEAYLVGLFSLLDSMLQTPMEDALTALSLAPEINRALLAREGELGRVLSAALAFESGQLGVEFTDQAAVIQNAFWEGARYARELSSSVHGP